MDCHLPYHTAHTLRPVKTQKYMTGLIAGWTRETNSCILLISNNFTVDQKVRNLASIYDSGQLWHAVYTETNDVSEIYASGAAMTLYQSDNSPALVADLFTGEGPG